MRKAFDPQERLDCQAVLNVRLNLNCRDEIVPILRALQHIYGQRKLRDDILRTIAWDVNRTSSRKRGRKGMDYWQILVLAAVRLGGNLDYDKLQDLAEQHRALRQIMGIGDWDQQTTFDWRRIQDNLTNIRPETIERINHRIVAEGHRLVPEAAETVRADSFVAQTNIHYPTESSLIRDGLRKILRLGTGLAALVGAGFVSHAYLLPRDADDRDVVVPQTRVLQRRLNGRIRRASFDRGFHSPKNQRPLAEIIAQPCLPMPGAHQAVEQEQEAGVEFRQARQRHPGIESAIHALQSGNGLLRCRDRTERGFRRYLSLGVLGPNLHVLGKLLIARENGDSPAAQSRRKAA